jgi:hypothetical protein
LNFVPNELRPRNAPELLDATFLFWRQNFAVLFAVATAFLPLVAFGVLDSLLPQSFELRLLSRAVTAMFESVAWAGVVVVVSERYMGHDVTAADALRIVWARKWPIFWANILFWLLVYVGLILLLAPGVYFFAKYFAMVPVVVLEGKGVFAAQERAATLSKGSRWRVVGLVALPWLTYLYVMGTITAVAVARASDITTLVLTRLLIACVYPLIGILATLLYYDLRFRNEGLDLDLMLAEQPTQPASL